MKPCQCPVKLDLHWTNESNEFIYCDKCGAEYKIIFQGKYLDENGIYTMEKPIQ